MPDENPTIDASGDQLPTGVSYRRQLGVSLADDSVPMHSTGHRLEQFDLDRHGAGRGSSGLRRNLGLAPGRPESGPRRRVVTVDAAPHGLTGEEGRERLRKPARSAHSQAGRDADPAAILPGHAPAVGTCRYRITEVSGAGGSHLPTRNPRLAYTYTSTYSHKASLDHNSAMARVRSERP